jgi:hypothetical protein
MRSRPAPIWRATNFPSEVAEMALAHAVSGRVEQAHRRGDLFERRRRLTVAWATFCGAPHDRLDDDTQSVGLIRATAAATAVVGGSAGRRKPTSASAPPCFMTARSRAIGV